MIVAATIGYTVTSVHTTTLYQYFTSGVCKRVFSARMHCCSTIHWQLVVLCYLHVFHFRSSPDGVFSTRLDCVLLWFLIALSSCWVNLFCCCRCFCCFVFLCRILFFRIYSNANTQMMAAAAIVVVYSYVKRHDKKRQDKRGESDVVNIWSSTSMVYSKCFSFRRFAANEYWYKMLVHFYEQTSHKPCFE